MFDGAAISQTHQLRPTRSFRLWWRL